MGDSERWWPELASGLSEEGARSFLAAFDTFRDEEEKWWTKAEPRVAELITAIRPNEESELRRHAIIDYITKLIQLRVNCEVVKFGSVPLETYLPDGDIDLTVVSHDLESKRTWIEDVHDVLQKEINNPKSEFRITQVQLISAEVKILKIYVEKLSVDISFDQLGGVDTLRFLEEVLCNILFTSSYSRHFSLDKIMLRFQQLVSRKAGLARLSLYYSLNKVDQKIGKDHLFKRSIILVKAWCYYESRLLGANCNLMSTYALETLVVYIFQFFHASLREPLQVLYLFLEFFSSFEWDKYCVSLSGPILLTSLSEGSESLSLIREDFQGLTLSRGRGGELLFTKAFFDGLKPLNQISKSSKFPVKFLNIIDPLCNTNNLGRSVNQGNCARIRRAFVLGARTLGGILHASEADVCTEIDQFFKNCNLRKRGSYQRPDTVSPKFLQGGKIPTEYGRRNDYVANASVS